MRLSLVSILLLASVCGAGAQSAPPAPAGPGTVEPQPEQTLQKPTVQPGPANGPTLPLPPSPEATTPANPLQPPPPIEVSPPAGSPPAPPLPPPSLEPPLRDKKAEVSPATAAYLREIGIDPDARDVVAVSQDAIGLMSLDALAEARDEARVRRFIYTRTFMLRFLTDPDNVRIEPDKYDIAFLTPDEVDFIADELNK